MGVDATQRKLAQSKARHIKAEATSVFEGCRTTRVEILGVGNVQIWWCDYCSIGFELVCVQPARRAGRANPPSSETYHSMSALNLQRAKLLLAGLAHHVSAHLDVRDTSLPTVAQLLSLRVNFCFNFVKEALEAWLPTGGFSGPLWEANLHVTWLLSLSLC